MIRLCCALAIATAAFLTLRAAAPAAQPASEQFHYNVNWPSGLSLGEASLSFSKIAATDDKPASLHSELTIDAAIPGFRVSDKFSSSASVEYCSTRFDKKLRHGYRKADELLKFDQEHSTVSRETLTESHETGDDLGKSDVGTPACAKDGLAFLAFLRHELANGRLPQQQTVFVGAAYDVKLDFRGAEAVKVGESSMQADRVNVSLHGPASSIDLVIFFAKDAGRTPVLFRVPLALGTFSMELIKP